MIEAVSGKGKKYIFKSFSLQETQVEGIATSVINMITSKLPEKARSLEIHLFILDFTKGEA